MIEARRASSSEASEAPSIPLLRPRRGRGDMPKVGPVSVPIPTLSLSGRPRRTLLRRLRREDVMETTLPSIGPSIRTLALTGTLAIAAAANGVGAANAPPPATRVFEHLASLVGKWKGEQSGTPFEVTYSLTADGSALMER